MRWACIGGLLTAAIVATSCASQPIVHANTFVKKSFGFIGPRVLTLVGSREDLDGLGLGLKQHGFQVLEADAVAHASTRYVAEVGGICGIHGVAPDVVVMKPAGMEWLHVSVTKTETGERVFSAQLGDEDDCPAAFYVEAAAAIARNWPIVSEP